MSLGEDAFEADAGQIGVAAHRVVEPQFLQNQNEVNQVFRLTKGC